MKLYIATTSLNFDAIMATETISPASFYGARSFGIRNYYDKVSGMYRNSILLFDRFPFFTIANKDVSHTPMVIEIESQNYHADFFEPVSQCDGVSIFRCVNTILLNPLTTRFHFNTERDLRATIAKADAIGESKYMLYQKVNALSVGFRPDFKLTMNHFNGIEDVEFVGSATIAEDEYRDKFKGFFISYLMGASLCYTPESASLLHVFKDLKNALYSYSQEQDGRTLERFMGLAEQANRLSMELDPRKKQIEAYLEEYLKETKAPSMLNGITAGQLIEYLSYNGVLKTVLNLLSGAKIIPACPGDYTDFKTLAVRASSNGDIDEIIRDAEAYVHSIIKRQSKASVSSDLLIPSEDYMNVKCNDDALNHDDASNLEIIYEVLMRGGYRGAELPLKKAEIILSVGRTIMARAEQDGTDISSVKAYVNGLLDHIESMKPFDVMSIDSLALQSLAVVMLYGAVDIDKMISQLVSNEISDYRIAFALWGVLFGYSSISQAEYNDFINRLDNRSCIGLCSVMHTIMLGTKPVAGIDEKPQTPMSTVSQDVQKALAGLSKQPNEETLGKIAESIRLESLRQSPRAFIMIIDDVVKKRYPGSKFKSTRIYKILRDNLLEDETQYDKKQLETKIYKLIGREKDYSKYHECILEALDVEDKVDDPQAVVYILNDQIDPESKEYKAIQKKLDPNSVSFGTKVKKVKGFLGSLFDREEYEQESDLEEDVKEQTVNSSVSSETKLVTAEPEHNRTEAKQEKATELKKSSIPLYLDDTAFSQIMRYVPVDEREEVERQLKFIQKVHKEGGYQKKDGTQVPIRMSENTNAQVIEHFRRNSRSTSKLKEDTIDRVVKVLQYIYPD